jgi:hypothetical protein
MASLAAPAARAAAATPLARQNSQGLKRGTSHFDLEYSSGLNEEKIKAQFIGKVYSILTAQLALTAAICAGFCFVEPMHQFGLTMVASAGLRFTLLFATMGTLCAMMCYKDQYPTNMWLLLAFTVFMSMHVGGICAAFYAAGKGATIAQALGLTCFIFASLTAYVWYSDTDFSFLNGFLFVALLSNILLGLLAWLSGWTFLIFAYHIFGVLIFCAFILYDTDQIVNKVQLEDCDTGMAIWGATELYLDFINLFLHILALLGMRD